MCLYPRLIKNKKFEPNKKNGGIIPAINDKRTLAVPVGCGKCIECKKQKSRNWQVRLHEEIRENKNGKFITLTFSNESIKEIIKDIPNKIKGYELDNEIATKAIRRFLERWRKKHKKSVRHWLVTEIGGNGTENIHLHGIIWTNEKNEEISRIWKYGGILIGERLYIKGEEKNKRSTGYVNEKTINYIVKYINKIDEKHKEYNSIILTSSGIGSGYLKRTDSKKNKYKGKKTIETYETRTGLKLALPMYYRNKIYTDEEKEKLWIEKLNKEERWVMGERIKINKDNGEYLEALKWARRKNKKLGYGGNKKNWEVKKYEEERRKYNMEKRLTQHSQEEVFKEKTPSRNDCVKVKEYQPTIVSWEEVIKNQEKIW